MKQLEKKGMEWIKNILWAESAEVRQAGVFHGVVCEHIPVRVLLPSKTSFPPANVIIFRITDCCIKKKVLLHFMAILYFFAPDGAP